jgi:hypothetical protein
LSGFFLSLLYPVSAADLPIAEWTIQHGARLADAQPSPYQVALLMQDHPWSTAPMLFVRFLPFFAISGLPLQTFPQPNGTIWQAWCRLADAQPSPYQVALLMHDHPWSTAPVLLSGFFLLAISGLRSRPSHSPMELFGKHGARLADAQPSPYQVAL